jgi:uracil-DNA glycosylase
LSSLENTIVTNCSKVKPIDLIDLPNSWKTAVGDEFTKPYMENIKAFLVAERRNGKQIFPPSKELFHAFQATPLEAVKVVIIGQDPYHGEGQAHGLCFSVRPGVKVPPSLANIYREMNEDLVITQPRHGYLESWAHQGVLLLNAVLSVEMGKPGSHQHLGWQNLTSQAIQAVNDRRKNVVFLLWGSYAQKQGATIDRRRHLVLDAPHPSPLSAHRGFFGCRHFSKANEYLISTGQEPIDWQLPPIPSH